MSRCASSTRARPLVLHAPNEDDGGLTIEHFLHPRAVPRLSARSPGPPFIRLPAVGRCEAADNHSLLPLQRKSFSFLRHLYCSSLTLASPHVDDRYSD